MTNRMPPIAGQARASSGWSNRVLLLALAGILFLTLYPFRFTSRAMPLAHSSPFLLGGVAKRGRELLDVTLNILLFVPFGFGLSEKLRERGWTRKTTFFAAGVIGFLVPYSIEFIQQYTPSRQSRWEDVCTNTTGAIAGFLMFTLCGRLLVKWASKVEGALRAWLTLRRAALLVPIYFVLWFGFSVALQKEARSVNLYSGSRHLAIATPGAAYELGPGAALAARIHHIKAAELKGYNFIYDALIFFPAGALFGMAVIPFGPRDIAASVLLAVEIVLPPWLLARILSHVSGHAFSVRSILLCLILVLAGGIWINTDRRSAAAET
jgi:glycopeptide antibiotics resistance protein